MTCPSCQWFCCLALSAALLPAISTQAGSQAWQWTAISTAGLDEENGGGAAWADFDNDGDLDLYISNWNLPNRLMRNDGADVFTEVTVPPLDVPGYSRRAVWGDFDNDGDLDVYVTQSQSSVLLRNDGALNFTNVSTGTPLELSSHVARCAVWFDADNDGYLDLYTSLTGGNPPNNSLFMNLQDGTFSEVATGTVADDGVGRGVAAADYDNDGDQDLYVANGAPGTAQPFRKTNRLLRNDGNGVWTDAGLDLPINDTGEGRGVAWGDMDNDGDLDLAVANADFENVGPPAGVNRVFRNDGNDVFTDVTPPELLANSSSRDVSWVDLDNDGDLDLYITFTTCCPNLLMVNDGAGNLTSAAPPGLDTQDNTNSVAWADYDQDGDLDGYFAVKDLPNYLLRNDLDNANHWLVVRLTGTISNRSGIGARINVTTGSLTQIREVQSGSGYLAQHMLPAHFGLGPATTVDEIEVRWPSGLISTLSNVAPDRIVDILESSCAGDANGDQMVDIADLNMLIGNFGSAVPEGMSGDVNADGFVNINDLNWILGNFGSACP